MPTRYIVPIITLTRAGLAAGLSLLTSLIALRVISAYESSQGDPVAVGWTLAGMGAMVAGLFTVVVLINRRRLADAQRRREAIHSTGDRRWLADVTIDSHSAHLLGVAPADLARTYALAATADGIELWATEAGCSAHVAQSKVLRVEAIPPSWSWNGVTSIAFDVDGLEETILIDLVGPLFGTFPATRAQQHSVVQALPVSGVAPA